MPKADIEDVVAEGLIAQMISRCDNEDIQLLLSYARRMGGRVDLKPFLDQEKKYRRTMQRNRPPAPEKK